MTQSILSVRPDKAAKQQRILERVEELSARTGAPVNRLVLEALRQFLDYQEGNKPSVETVLQNATNLMGTVSTTMAIQRQESEAIAARIAILENLADKFYQSLCVDSERLNAIPDALLGVIKELHPDWTEERLDGLKSLLSPSHPKLPRSLFKGRVSPADEIVGGKGPDGAQG